MGNLKYFGGFLSGMEAETIKDHTKDPVYQQIKAALKELAKPASKEALRKQHEELEKIKREKGLKAYQDELFRRVGLG